MFWYVTLMATMIALLAFRWNHTSRRRTELLGSPVSRTSGRFGWMTIAMLAVLAISVSFAVLQASDPIWAQENTAEAPSSDGDTDTPSTEPSEDTTDATTAAPEVVEKNTEGIRGERWFIVLVTAIVIVVPFVLGAVLSMRWRMPDYRIKFTTLLFCFLAGLAVTVMGFPPKLAVDLKGGVILVYEILGVVVDVEQAKQSPEEGQDDTPADAQESSVDMGILTTALSRRIDPSGTRETVIRGYGKNQVEITIPEANETEVERIKRVIQSVGTLEFRIVANNRQHKSIIAKANEDTTGAARRVFDSKGNLLAWWVPITKGEEKSFVEDPAILVRPCANDPALTEVLVVDDPYDVSGEYLTNSKRGTRMGKYCVEFSFNTKGSVRFKYLTGDNLPDEATKLSSRLGIILDESLFSAPNIRKKIAGDGEITGDFTKDEANELVGVLNAGRLPARLDKDPISELRTGPTLGSDQIRKGSWAIGLSMISVLVFMLFYYRFAGFVACGALIMNLVMIMGIMTAIRAQFSLAGLAGLVLTVGMAVDANVLIFERIREELNRNATLRMAIRNGFSRATSAIVDANLTTLFTATILYWIGTEQVKGFAVILWLGVVLSMFTAIFCSRIVFDVAERQRWLTKLKMKQLLGVTKIDFLSKRHIAAICSVVVISVGLIGVASRGKGLMDIDFTGGISIQLIFKTPQEIEDVREKLSNLPDLSVSDVRIQDEQPNLRFTINTSTPQAKDSEEQLKGEEYLEYVKELLEKKFGDDLRHYSLSIKVASSESPKPTKPKPATSAANHQGRDDLPPDTLLASADPMAFLFTQDPEKTEPTPEPEPPAEETTPEPEPPAEKTEPTPEPEPPAEETTPEPEPPAEKTEPTPEPEPPAEETTPEPEPPAEKTEPTPEPEPPAEETTPEPEPPTEKTEPAPEPEPPAEETTPEPEPPAEKTEPTPEPEPPAEETTPEPEPPAEKTEPTPEPEPPAEETTPEPEPPAEKTEPDPEPEPPAEETTPEPEPPAEKTEPDPGPEPPAEETTPEPEPPAEKTEPDPGPEPPAEETTPEPEPPAEKTEPDPGPEPPAEKTEPTTEPEPPAEKTEPDPEPEQPDSEPKTEEITEEVVDHVVTKIDLVFQNKVTKLAVQEMVREAADTSDWITRAVQFDVGNTATDYRPSEEKSYNQWVVEMYLPREEAVSLLGLVKKQIESKPIFPSSGMIGTKVASKTRTAAIFALIASLLVIVGYLWIRFQRVMYGLAAVVALVHDVLITLGMIALSAYVAHLFGFLGIEEFKIGLPVLAAFLTIIGYSLNDTIVVFDRIREVRGKSPALSQEMINRSINQTLSRTLLTSFTTLLVVLILFFGGGQGIHTFAFALVVGVFVGTYSSIFVASPVLLLMSQSGTQSKQESKKKKASEYPSRSI